ncbi:MAG: pyruvate:ferredoxin (flavodoxin) oxidoreductase [Liquorilactobacillus nagelii]|uniref:pyruvate:ferredoxin (flavodoxin) oxidoreductase n=1 Tax=Liquorilactobacillus nagelii TaxID=82688 RepID=UPI0021CAEAD1|nr:pyruvate:ferredoxin (flavodoxin) oxidoreductase [Liquorilactobacillus nagelii]
MNGDTAAAYVAYAFSEAAVIYPITPASLMAEKAEYWSTIKNKNLFNQQVKVIEMQSEAGVAGTVHGLAKVGVLSTTFTSSQGLLLMIPTLYKLAGEFLPVVIHVASRAISTGNLSIYGDHSDIMAVRQTGVIILSASSVQEAALFAGVAHLTAASMSMPVINFFDGFNTSHELRNIELPTYKQLREKIDLNIYQKIRANSVRNDHPRAYGISETPDIFFQQQETTNSDYQAVERLAEHWLNILNPLFKTNSSIVDYFGSRSANTIIIAMGSVIPTIQQVVEEGNKNNKNWGVINIHLYRPFPASKIIETIPSTVKNIIVLDRTKEKGAFSDPLGEDIQSIIQSYGKQINVFLGRYGLGSKDVTPDQIRASFLETENPNPKKHFSLGIIDNVTNLSLPPSGKKDLTSKTVFQAQIWGRGSDGATSGSSVTTKIVGELTDLNVQGQFKFDPRKSGGLTISHLRFSKSEIKSAYKVENFNFISCYCDNYIKRFNLFKGLSDNGIFLLNTHYSSKEINAFLPKSYKYYFVKHKINFYLIDANKIARQLNIYPHINSIMQTCFFYLTNLLDSKTSTYALMDKFKNKYESYGENLVNSNLEAIKIAVKKLNKATIYSNSMISAGSKKNNTNKKSFENEIHFTMTKELGEKISVKTMLKYGLKDGSFPLNTSKLDKPDIAAKIPIWRPEYCVNCNLCATICPHAAIRPFLFKKNEKVPFKTVPFRENSQYKYRLQVSPLDCTGCTLCYDMCPLRNKGIKLEEISKHKEIESKNWNFSIDHQYLDYPESNKKSIRSIQLKQPLLEFSGACAGCGETPYVKLLTQIFSKNLTITNATGCSSIWGGSAPSIPYSTDKSGNGPIWATSLFEDNAEYGFGMGIGTEIIRKQLVEKAKQIAKNKQYSEHLRITADKWINSQNNPQVVNSLIACLANEAPAYPELKELLDNRQYLLKRVTWIVGGDGWAYDIDYAGIDHVISQNKNINILILDNEGYSNTGGQSSKASPTGARTKFTNFGNKKVKKDFASILMTYDHVYIAQVCLAANPEQTLKSFLEASAYEGPSVIIAYSTCKLHGIYHNTAIEEQKKAVKCGYWPLFRRFPISANNQKPCLKMDSAKPIWNLFQEFLKGELRYQFHNKQNTSEYSELLEKNEEEARKRYSRYKKLSKRQLDAHDV